MAGAADLREALHGGWRVSCDELPFATFGFDRRSKQWPTGIHSTLAQGWCGCTFSRVVFHVNWCPRSGTFPPGGTVTGVRCRYRQTGMLKLLSAAKNPSHNQKVHLPLSPAVQTMPTFVQNAPRSDVR